MKLGAVILAAGFSSRINGFKPLMQLGKRTLLAHCIQLMQTVKVDKIVVVCGHHGDAVAAEAKNLGALVCPNAEYANGMFSSVQVAMADMTDRDAFFVLPVDIPLIRPTSLQALLNAFDGTHINYPVRNSTRGHPPLIPQHLHKKIQKYNGRGGLKKLLKRYPAKDIEVWDDGIVMDCDTQDDFQQLAHRKKQFAIGSRAEAESLAKLRMPKRGVAHGQAVAAVACTLAHSLRQNGIELDLALLYNGALLHDVAKGTHRHEAEGAKLMRQLGLDALADLVGSHRDTPLPKSGIVGEKELVCLADKLVRGTTLMPVHQRFAEKLNLYNGDQEACLAIQQRKANALALQHAVEKITSRSIADILSGLKV